MESHDNTGEVEITATYEEYKSFVSSPVWHDMKRELETQKSMILDHLGTTDEPREIHRLQGQLTACNDFISMPTDFIAVLEHKFAEKESVGSKSESTTDVQYYDKLLQHYEEPNDGNGL